MLYMSYMIYLKLCLSSVGICRLCLDCDSFRGQEILKFVHGNGFFNWSVAWSRNIGIYLAIQSCHQSGKAAKKKAAEEKLM